jgi:predicted flap endonuclease-1-like 5' DNA nuclease
MQTLEGKFMLYLLQQFWPYCLAALILGLLVSWFTRGKENTGRSFWFNCLLILGIIGIILAVLLFFKGRFGLMLEVALLALSSYLIGCLIPCLCGCWGNKNATGDASVSGRPAGLMAARGGKSDDLTKLRLIDKNREAKLNGLGFYHYDQICALKGEEKSWLWNAVDLKSVAGENSTANEWAGWAQSCDLAALSKAGVKTIPAAVTAVAPLVAPVTKPVAAPTPTPAAPQAAMAKVEGEDLIAGQRPQGLTAARNNKSDDLKRIRGIGPQNEGRLHGLGIWHFDQISAWTKDNIEWVGSYLAFPGRIDREDWVAQAKILASGGVTEFATRVDKGEVPTSIDNGSKGQDNIEKVQPKT